MSGTPINGTGREGIHRAIDAERERQDEQWGGPDHDDRHGWEEWTWFIQKQLNIARSRVEKGDEAEYRRRLVNIGALAVAAIESFDRRGPIKEETR
jgi:hypothetical protein